MRTEAAALVVTTAVAEVATVTEATVGRAGIATAARVASHDHDGSH